MSEIREITGGRDGAGKRFGIVASRFNARWVDGLIEGALECLMDQGVAREDIVIARVPGAWEIPLALQAVATTGQVDALVALGVVIRGETAHFDYICAECSRGISHVTETTGLPVGFGVLTCETEEQAAARSGGRGENKGREAALAALEMANLLSRLRGSAAAASPARARGRR
ncbi:MAG: 6,7-dimethyl-8-ribityllumazine synthase [Acidobacteriota bacterium]